MGIIGIALLSTGGEKEFTFHRSGKHDLEIVRCEHLRSAKHLTKVSLMSILLSCVSGGALTSKFLTKEATVTLSIT